MAEHSCMRGTDNRAHVYPCRACEDLKAEPRIARALELLEACELLTLYPGVSGFVLSDPCEGITRGHWLMNVQHENGETDLFASGPDLTSGLIAAAKVMKERARG